MNIAKKLTLAMSGAALAFAPVAAQASVAQVQSARASAQIEDANEVEGNMLGIVMLGLVGAAMIYGLIKILDDNPTSP